MEFPLINKTYIADTVILGNGDFPNAEIPLHLLKSAQFVVCCDGAANEYIDKGYIPNVIVGDCDSLATEIKEKYAHILHIEHEQEDNDQTKAIRFCDSQNRKDIVIVGATGKREDHTLGNISLLINYMQMGMNVTTVTDYGVFVPVHGDADFESFNGQQVSIFNFTCKSLKEENMVYPTRAFDNWWQGTLNESKGDTFSIKADGYYLVFRAY